MRNARFVLSCHRKLECIGEKIFEHYWRVNYSDFEEVSNNFDMHFVDMTALRMR